MPVNILDFSVSLFGPGRAAKAFGRSWVRAGGNLGQVIARSSAGAQRAVREIGSGQAQVADSDLSACDVLILGVPDDAIRNAARRLAPAAPCRFAFHLSGALCAEELAPLRAAGAAVGSLHPVRAFSGSVSENWNGAFVAIEGDERAIAVGERIVEAVAARGRRVAAEGKPLYHAATTLAAGGMLALVSMAAEAWGFLGIPEAEARAALTDLSARAAAAASDRDFAEAFTGPVARRDVGTVRAHRAALASRPEALAVYAALARETLRRTPGRGKEEEIRAVLEGREA